LSAELSAELSAVLTPPGAIQPGASLAGTAASLGSRQSESEPSASP
jgi:hypothetical protein